MPKKTLKNIFKIIVSLALLIFILNKINLTKTWEALNNTNPLWLLWPLSILIITTLLRTYRWYLLQQRVGKPLSYINLLRLNYIGHYFNTFLPTRLGSDVVKAYYLSKKHGITIVNSSISVFTDRFLGIIAFVILNLLSLGIGYRQLPAWVILTTLSINLTLIILVLQSVNSLGFFENLFKRFEFSKKIKEAYHELKKLNLKKGLLSNLIILSLFAHLIFVGYNFSFAHILNLDLSFKAFFIYIPIIATIVLIPITINGLGFREYLIILLFQSAGLTLEEAFAFGILSRVVNLLHSAIGGLVYLSEGLHPTQDESL